MDGCGTSLPYPNKQAFPALSDPGCLICQTSLSSPTKEIERSFFSVGKSAIDLPQIYDQGHGKEEMMNRSKDALKSAVNMKNTKHLKAFDDTGKDDLTQRVHTTHLLPYQYKTFRSSVQMKMVPFKRHKEMFASSQPQTLPAPLAKTRVLPIHTRPFLWGQEAEGTPTTVRSPLSLPDKFLAEEEHIRKVRCHKRRYSVPAHRKRFTDLHVGGRAPSFVSRHDNGVEMSSVRNTVVPSEIQALYTGKGFQLPVSHSSNKKREEYQVYLKAEYALPHSAPAAVSLPFGTPETDTKVSATTQSISIDNGDRPQNKQNTPGMPQRHQKLKPTADSSGDHRINGRKIDKMSENQYEKSDVTGRAAPVRSEVKRGRTVERPATKRVSKQKLSRDRKAGKCPATLPQLHIKSLKGENFCVFMSRVPAQISNVLEEATSPPPIVGVSLRYANYEMWQRERPESPTPELDLNDDMEIMEQSTSSDRHELSVEISTESPEIIPSNEPEDKSMRPESEMEIEVTPDEDIRKLRIPLTPITPKAVSPNPLKSVDLILDISDERRQELATDFHKLDTDKDGHISIAELQTSLPDALTRGQYKFIKEVYELVSFSTFFGMDEFVTVTCLCDEMLQLSEPLKEAYDKLDSSILEQLISQYVVLFATVDRQQTGSISIEALQEILTMALDTDLMINTQLYSRILQTIDKEYSSAINKVEYLTFLPYFFSCK